MKNIYSLSLLALFSIASINAQTDDNILWSKFGISKSLNDKTSLSFAPIIRHNNDISKYQNISFDYAITHKFAKNWSAKLTGRTWFLPNGRERQFIWPQISYSKKLNAVKLSSYLRYHLALDIKNVIDPDFLRWDVGIAFLNLGKFEPYLAVEPWLRLNNFNQIQRVRLKPGLKYTISSKLNTSLTLWREENNNLAQGNDFNIWVLALNYKL